MPPAASANGGFGLPPPSRLGDQIGEHGLLAPIGQLPAHDLDGCVAPALTGQHARVSLHHAHGRRAGLGHRGGQRRHRLVEASAQVEHHCLVIAVQRAQRLALVEARQRLVEGVAIVLGKEHPGVEERSGQTRDAFLVNRRQPAVRIVETARAHLLEAQQQLCLGDAGVLHQFAGLLERSVVPATRQHQEK